MRETTWNAWYRKEKCKGIPSGVGAGEVLIFLQGCELGGGALRKPPVLSIASGGSSAPGLKVGRVSGIRWYPPLR